MLSAVGGIACCVTAYPTQHKTNMIPPTIIPIACSGLFSMSKWLVSHANDYRAHSVASGAAASSTNLELAALRRVLRRAAEEGLLDHEKAEAAAHVKNTSSLGTRVGNWLTPEQAKALLLAPDENTLKGKRDGAILGVLVGCGLRRAERVSLVLKEVQMRDDRWIPRWRARH
jgi:site-specific recombinase XerD